MTKAETPPYLPILKLSNPPFDLGGVETMLTPPLLNLPRLLARSEYIKSDILANTLNILREKCQNMEADISMNIQF